MADAVKYLLDDFEAGKLEDRGYDEAELSAAFANLPRVAAE